MSTQIANQDGVTITQYARAKGGVAYQVTWGVDKYVSFDNEAHACVFMRLLTLATEK